MGASGMRQRTARPLFSALILAAGAHSVAPAAHLLNPQGQGSDGSALAVAPAHALAAQTLRGTVVRPDRTPLPDVALAVRTDAGLVLARATSDSTGRFRLDIDAGEQGSMQLEATLLGYADWETAPFELDADADLELFVAMQVAAIPLDPVTVEARSRRSTRRLADFERRMENPAFGGYFLEEEDIARRPASRPSNLPLAAPGMTVRPVPGPFDRWEVYSGDCPATLFVDGVRINQTVTSVDEYLSLDRIAGVEVYPRSMGAPPQYQDARSRECGVVLYWTKELRPDREGGWSATKIGVGVGLITGLLALGLVL